MTSVTLRHIIHHKASGKPEVLLADPVRTFSLRVNRRYARNIPDAKSGSTGMHGMRASRCGAMEMWLERNRERLVILGKGNLPTPPCKSPKPNIVSSDYPKPVANDHTFLDESVVIVITSRGNGRTQRTNRWMAAVDVHPADEAGQPKGGDLAKTPAIRNRAAWKFGLPAPQQSQQ